METSTYDYIVVGAGSSGSVIAARLSESGSHSVLLLEAGTKGPEHFWSRIPIGIAKLIDEPEVNWCYESEPEESSGQRRIPVPRGRMLGGSSSINGMVYTRGQAQDYDHWSQLGNRGWSYQDVLPLFKKSESFDGGSDEFRGRDGPLKVTKTPKDGPFFNMIMNSAEAIGIKRNSDYNGASQEGVAMSQVTIHKGTRQSTAEVFLKPARDRANLKIETGAMAESLIRDGKRCVGIRYAVGGQAREARARREVVVSGGAINSPKLLELSGIGQPDLLRSLGIAMWHELPGVGENLRDHLSPRLKFSIAKPNIAFTDKGFGWRLVKEALRYGVSRDGLLSMTAVPVRLYFRTREGLETPDATMSIMPFAMEMRNRERRIARRRAVTLTPNVLRPDSRGSIHVTSTDPAVPPAIRFNFLSSPLDREGLLAAMRTARALMAAKPIADVVGEEITPGAHLQTDDELLGWVRATAETTYHPSGTCKMGNDPMAVVDDRLRVHGIEGLRVADCSIMPTLTSGNTNAPAIMIGEKCAEMMLADAEATRQPEAA